MMPYKIIHLKNRPENISAISLEMELNALDNEWWRIVAATPDYLFLYRETSPAEFWGEEVSTG